MYVADAPVSLLQSYLILIAKILIDILWEILLPDIHPKEIIMDINKMLGARPFLIVLFINVKMGRI